MALLHRADLRPSKIELIAAWAPTQPWFTGDAAAPFANVASYRFDDPDGEVGIETIVVRAGDGPLLQVPLSYRSAPLEGADDWLEVDGERESREPSARVLGSGHPGAAVPSSDGTISTRHDLGTTVVSAGDLCLVVARSIESEVSAAPEATASISGTWAGQTDARPLVWTTAIS